MTQLDELRPIYGGFHVKALDQETCVHLMRMLVNWRVSRWHGPCDSPASTPGPYWCYQGLGEKTYFRALGEALAWDGTVENPPQGWIKSYTGERRETQREAPEENSPEDHQQPLSGLLGR